jgi:hypothetical protein
MKTIIKYKRWRLLGDLLLGMAWALFFVVGLITNHEHPEWYYYFHILISFIYLGKYLYESHHQYLIIEDETITKPNLFHTQKVKISDIVKVKTFAGDITICAKNMEIGIAKDIVDQESYKNLKMILEELEIEENHVTC